MIEDCPETAHKLRRAECFCSRATLDDLLSDEVMAPVLRSVGYDAHQPEKLGDARAGAGEGGVIAAPDLDQGVTTPAEQPHRP
jgi:hypothetical protein